MKIYYDSLTGNTRKFAEKLPFETTSVAEVSEVNEPFILLTYTINFGEVPSSSREFLRKHGDYLIGVASSGNRNWGSNFGRAADLISQKYNVPILLKFELSGTKEDVRLLTERVAIVWQNGRN